MSNLNLLSPRISKYRHKPLIQGRGIKTGFPPSIPVSNRRKSGTILAQKHPRGIGGELKFEAKTVPTTLEE